jgi:hypothetical protein
MTPREIEARIALRHREPGHLRFALPEVLCADPAARTVRETLGNLDGVWRVDLYPRHCKLSVRYHEGACSVRDVALGLRRAVMRAHDAGLFEPGAADLYPAEVAPGPLAALGAKARMLRAQAMFMKELVKLRIQSDPVLRNVLTERNVTGFINDVVTFYLIKVHWDLITKRWIGAPFRHRYEWLTIFYLTFLLVRSRRKPPPK